MANPAASSPPVPEPVYAAIVSIAADAIITIDDAQRIVLFNEGAEHIFGWTADDAIGRSVDLLLPLAMRERHQDHIRDFAEGAVSARRMGARREIAGRRRNGEIFPAEASISRVEVEGQRFFTVVLRDVTEEKWAQSEREALLAREQTARETAELAERRWAFLARASDVLDESLDYATTLRTVARLAVSALADVCIVDIVGDDGRVMRVEMAANDPLMEQVVARLRGLRLGGEHPFLTQRALATGAPDVMQDITPQDLARYCHESAHLGALRELAPVSMLAVPLVARGSTLGAIALLATRPGRSYGEADVALAEELASRAALALDNARLYGVAQRAIRGRDTVLGVVSHDLRNPLSTVAMCASTLLDPEPPTVAQTHDLAETMQAAVRWMQRIIQDLLDVTSLEAGRLSLRREAVPVRAILQQAATLLEPLAVERSLSLRLAVEGELPAVNADAQRVLQVLSNLVGNSCRFTDAGGTVTLRAERHGEDVEFSVTDTGIGIPEADQARVFDRFWNADRGPHQRGYGLGLAIAKGIVEAHGGRVWLRSAPGEGTVVSFTLPVQ